MKTSLFHSSSCSHTLTNKQKKWYIPALPWGTSVAQNNEMASQTKLTVKCRITCGMLAGVVRTDWGNYDTNMPTNGASCADKRGKNNLRSQ